MMRSLVLFCVSIVLVSCGDSSQPQEPQDVALVTFNVALAGAFIPYEQQRREALGEAIAAIDADIVCLEEVWTQADKDMIRAAAEAKFPNAVLFENDLDTSIDDPTDQDGQVPPAPTTVPCTDTPAFLGEGTVEEQMTAAIDCISEHCNTIAPDDEAGQTTSTTCAEVACLAEVASLAVSPDSQQQRCYACIATQLPTSTFGEIRASCPSVINQVLAFEGQNGVMILSRHPLKNAENWVLPGTWNRRSILSATAELPNGAELDVYCNHLTPIFDSVAYPYTGQYGNGMSGAAGWQAEQELQAQKLISYVTETSDGRPAVILGDMNTGSAYSAEDPADDIVAEGEETLNILEASFSPAYTADYTPLCTYCSTNPVTNPDDDPDVLSTWIDHILLYNFPADSVVSTARVYDEPVVLVNDMTMPDEEILVPLSDHYGMRSVITVPASLEE